MCRQLGRLTGRQAPPADRIVAVAVAYLLATVAMISWCLSSLLVLARLEVMPRPHSLDDSCTVSDGIVSVILAMLPSDGSFSE